MGTLPQAWDPEWGLSKRVVGNDGEWGGVGRFLEGAEGPNARLSSEKSPFCLDRVGKNPGGGRMGCGGECGFWSQTVCDLGKPLHALEPQFLCLEKGSNKIHSRANHPELW